MRAQQLQNFIIEGGLERQDGDEDEEKHVNVSFNDLDEPEDDDDTSPLNLEQELARQKMGEEGNERSQINNFQE